MKAVATAGASGTFGKSFCDCWLACLCAGPYKSRLKIESFESTSPRVNFAAEILGSLKLAV